MANVEKRIIDFDTITETDEDYYLLVDHGTEGTFKVPIKLAGPIEKIGDEELQVGNNIIDGINQINSSLTNKELWAWSDNTRFQMIDGGYKNMGSYVIINLVVKAKTSATNSPSISSVASAYKPTVDTALSCIDITSGISSAITDSVPCGISSAAGTIYIKSIITDHIYAITGYYLIA